MNLKDITAYGLFETLFYNRTDPYGVASEKDKFISYLESKNILNATASYENRTDFEKRMFANQTDVLGKGLKVFCARERQVIGKDHPALTTLLTDAYNKLRTLYTQHVADVYKFMQSIFVIDNELLKALNLSGIEYSFIDPTKSVVRLNAFFVSHPNGSMVALSEKMSEGRRLLMKHYIAVEETYKTALDQLESGLLGSSVNQNQTSNFRK
jgi:UTP-glucose-1-phosphate uridylyltransferase